MTRKVSKKVEVHHPRMMFAAKTALAIWVIMVALVVIVAFMSP